VILVDTSVWVDYLRRADPALVARLEAGEVLTHPLVIGELAVGNLGQRAATLDSLADLPKAIIPSDNEVLGYIERHRLQGRGLSYVDACLLASTQLTPGARLWTRDRRLAGIAEDLDVSLPATP